MARNVTIMGKLSRLIKDQGWQAKDMELCVRGHWKPGEEGTDLIQFLGR